MFCGLNVFQYLGPGKLEPAVAEAARVLRPGGYFIGDFITPDHIRCYAHVVQSASERMISLRQPRTYPRFARRSPCSNAFPASPNKPYATKSSAKPMPAGF